MTTMEPTRRRLPETRQSVTRRCDACGFKFYVTVSFYDGDSPEDACKPGEVFVQISKHGTELSGMVDALAVTISVGLQYGVPWSVLREKYVHTRFGQSSPGYSSLADALAKTIDAAMAQRRAVLGVDDEPRRAATTTGAVGPRPAGGPPGGHQEPPDAPEAGSAARNPQGPAPRPPGRASVDLLRQIEDERRAREKTAKPDPLKPTFAGGHRDHPEWPEEPKPSA